MSTLSTFKKLLLDMVPVFLAVFLAYQVNEYRDYRKEKQNLVDAIKNIRFEMVSNKMQADTSAYYHRDMLYRMDTIRRQQEGENPKEYKSFMHLLQTFSPKKRNLVLPQLSDISYEAAKRKHAISSMDYETINKISSVYVNIEEGLKSTQKVLLNSISDPDVMILEDFDRTFILLYGSIQELYSQEKYLSKQIGFTLEHLEKAFPEEK